MNTPAYVPIEAVSKHFSVSISTVRGWIRRKHIPPSTYIQVGNTYRFSIPAVVAALSSEKVSPKTNNTDDTSTKFDLDPDKDF